MQQAARKPQPAKVSFWQFSTQVYFVREIDSNNKFIFWFLNKIVLKDYPLNLEEAEIWQVNKEIDNFIILQPQSIVLINSLEIIDIGYKEILSSAFRIDYSDLSIQIFIHSLIHDGEIIWKYEIRPLNERVMQFADYLCRRIGEMEQQMHTQTTAIQE